LFRTYYQLTKPGIIYGNLLTAAAGFLLASAVARHIDLWLLLATLAGTSLVIASACVCNNYIDRGIDRKMARTKKRALVAGLVPARNALIYGALLGVLGFLVRGLWVNSLVVAIGVIAFVDYVALYGLAKRRSIHSTLVGSISGAAPITAGYCAVTGRLDTGALLVFLMLVLWQMPHFYAIAMYRFDDYKAAGLPVLTVKRGMHSAKVQILLYVVAFIFACAALTVFGYTGYVYLAVMLIVGLVWLRLGLQGLKTADDKAWARKMFFFSLIVILVLSAMVSVGALLP
jgi:protoheme IX farnesyltransferase